MLKKIIIFILLATVVFIGGFIFLNSRLQTAEAGSGENVYGWAWSENIGWISFNNTSGGGSVNYGVHICTSETDSLCVAVAAPKTGKFIGYAWSRGTTADVGGIGWISFADFDGDGDIDAADKNIVGSPCAPNCEARFDFGTKQVSGWARALAYGGGWDGWIKLRGTATDGSPYGTRIDTGTSPAQFRDWIWSDMVIGWISLNCKDGGYNEATGAHYSVCGTSDYKVMTNLNTPPIISNFQHNINYCNILQEVGLVSVSWSYTDTESDSQTNYDIQVRSGAVLLVDCPNVSESLTPPFPKTGTSSIRIKETPTPALCDLPSYIGDIGYGGTFEWRVRAKDSAGNWSDWSPWIAFSTAAHGYPWIDFSWAPLSPATGELTQFADQSLVFGLGVTKSSWLWEFTDWSFATGSNPSVQNPLGAFTSAGNKDVYLTVTDSTTPIGFSCRNKKTVTSQLPLPEWKEIAPF